MEFFKNFEGKECQSFAPAYFYMDSPIALLTFGRSSNVLSRKSLWWILRLNLKISFDWSGQSKLCSILKTLRNRKKRRLLFNIAYYLVCANSFSQGIKSGEYVGRKIASAPVALMASIASGVWWTAHYLQKSRCLV